MDFTHQETVKLIGAFKKHPVIYDVDAIGYNDRKKKSQAWKTIAAEVDAHTEICKRKMESLLSSCRREKNKILKGRESDKPEDAYEPKWRYWNEFKFLRGIKDDEEDPLGTVSNDVCEPSAYSQWSTSRLLAQQYRKPQSPNPPIVTTATSTSSAIKRTVEPDDEYTAIGIMVEAKLKKMLKSQQIYTQNIINQILYKGLLFQLSTKSEIRDTDFASDDSASISEQNPHLDQKTNDTDGPTIAKKSRRASASSEAEAFLL